MEYPKGVKRKGIHRGKVHHNAQAQGTAQHQPHPNGGDVRAMDMNRSKMPDKHKARPIVNKSLPTGNDFSGLGKMPKQVTTPASDMEPRR